MSNAQHNQREFSKELAAAVDQRCTELVLLGKKQACLILMQRVRNECLGKDADGWASHTGRIFGEYLKELETISQAPSHESSPESPASPAAET